MSRLTVTAMELRGSTPSEAMTGVRWPDGTVECRYRVTHPDGSLVADDGTIGVVLTDPSVECDVCSDACG